MLFVHVFDEVGELKSSASRFKLFCYVVVLHVIVEVVKVKRDRFRIMRNSFGTLCGSSAGRKVAKWAALNVLDLVGGCLAGGDERLLCEDEGPVRPPELVLDAG